MSERLLGSLREAVLILLAMLGTMACTALFAAGSAPAVLGAVLALSLARSDLASGRRGALEALLVLPLIAIASIGIGILLRAVPWVGAAVFVGGMALSIWLRRFGTHGRRIGSLAALPLVTILVVPGLPRHGNDAWLHLLLPVAIALVALAWVVGAQALGRRLGWLATPAVTPVEPWSTGRTGRTGTMRPSPPTRMALQMAAALGASFVVGLAAFPSHWSWIVLTAFIVNSGNRGRQDVVHKSALRVLGAAAGTVVSMTFVEPAALGGPWAAALILASVFLGVWLRPAGYGWWALFVTVALSLLQTTQPGAAQPLLLQRLLEILIGAAIGLAAAWFVVPIRSTDVLRRRIAEALAATSDALEGQAAERRSERMVASIRHVQQMRPSFQARGRLFRRWQPLQPVDWIDVLCACEAPLVALVEQDERPAAVRRAVGAARKAMREPEQVLPALTGVMQALDRGHAPGTGLSADESSP